MKLSVRILCAALVICMAAALGACGLVSSSGISADDATTYIKGDLDAYYKGTYDQKYLSLVSDYTLTDAMAQHDGNISAEADYLMQWLEIEYPNAAVTNKAEQVVAALYAKADYTVGAASRIEGGHYAVEVKVKPIEVLHMLTEDDFTDAFLSALEGYESYDEITDDDWEIIDADYGMAILNKLESYIPQLTYGKEQTILFQLQLDEDGKYTATESAYQTFDAAVIDYSGNYME